MNEQRFPESLWHDSQIVMAPPLADSYRDELTFRGLYEDACRYDPKDRGNIGGEGSQETLKHFARLFKASSARVQYLVLNPGGQFKGVSDEILSFMMDGKVSILDIPCGTGGGLLGYLSTIAELRRSGLMQKTPVELTVVGGDISNDARTIYESMLGRLKEGFSSVGLRVSCHHSTWDVTDVFSTGQLVDRWLERCPKDEHYMIFVSAFSGFARSNKETVLMAFHSVVGRFHNKPCLLVWVEPKIKKSTSFVTWITEHLLQWFRNKKVLSEAADAAEFFYRHPFTGQRIPSSVQVRFFPKRNTADA